MAESEFRKESVVRCHHVYRFVWTPVVGEELILEPEDCNEHDKFAVAVKRNDEIIGHMPRSFSRVSWYFLKYRGKIRCVITGKRRHGVGLEVPCTYTFVGSARLIQKLSKRL